MQKRLATVAAILAITLGVAGARAEEPSARTKNAVRELVREGGALAEENRWDQALDRYRRAYALIPAPPIAVLEARALEKLGQLIEAAERYEQLKRSELPLGSPLAYTRAVEEAQVAAEALRLRIPRLKLTVVGHGADDAALAVGIENEPVPAALRGVDQPVNPGAHLVWAQVPGRSAAHRRVVLLEGKSYVVELELREGAELPNMPPPAAPAPAPDAAPPPSPAAESDRSTWGWVAVGAGAAGVTAGLITGFMALDRKSTLDGACTTGTGETLRCPATAQDDLDAYRAYRVASYVGFGVGVVGVGVGLALLLTGDDTAPPQSGKVTLRPFFGPGSAGVRGAF
jgi:hypothetical protein